jgi:urease accessory protein
MTWNATLDLDFALQAGRTTVAARHMGPLRLLQPLYPEGDAVCHTILVHPPGGLVGGDTLSVQVRVQPQAHALVATPGATRYYRSAGPWAEQRTHICLEAGACLEWLPCETLAYPQCKARNHWQLELAPTAQCLALDVTALGLPLAQRPFDQGCVWQHLEIPGVWLERGCLDAADLALMNGPVGLNGHRALCTLLWAQGSDWSRAQAQRAREQAWALIDALAPAGGALVAGVTSPNPRVVVVRALGPVVEPVMGLLRQIWAQWRAQAFGLAPTPARIWTT